MARRFILCLTTSLLACSNVAAPESIDSEEQLSPRPATVLETPVSAPGPVGDEVYGRVVGDDHLPVDGARVVVDGKSVQTDEQGAFMVHAPGTYDVGLVSSIGGRISYWMGLTRRDPTLILHGVTSAKARSSATIAPSAKIAFDGVVRLEEPALLDSTVYDGTTLRLGWSGPQTAHARLWAFDVQTGSRRHYPRAAQLDLSVQPGGAVSWPIAWQPMTERTVVPDVSLPDGWVVTRAQLHARTENARRILEEESGLDALSGFAVPSIDDLSFDLTVDARVADTAMTIVSKPFAANENPEKLAFAEPIVAVAPMDAATASKETRLVWSDGSKGIRTVELMPVGAGPSFVVVTAASSLPLAPLAQLAPLGASYAWKVTSTNAYDSPDDLAADRGTPARTIVTSTTPMRTMTVR